MRIKPSSSLGAAAAKLIGTQPQYMDPRDRIAAQGGSPSPIPQSPTKPQKRPKQKRYTIPIEIDGEQFQLDWEGNPPTEADIAAVVRKYRLESSGNSPKSGFETAFNVDANTPRLSSMGVPEPKAYRPRTPTKEERQRATSAFGISRDYATRFRVPHPTNGRPPTSMSEVEQLEQFNRAIENRIRSTSAPPEDDSVQLERQIAREIEGRAVEGFKRGPEMVASGVSRMVNIPRHVGSIALSVMNYTDPGLINRLREGYGEENMDQIRDILGNAIMIGTGVTASVAGSGLARGGAKELVRSFPSVARAAESTGTRKAVASTAKNLYRGALAADTSLGVGAASESIGKTVAGLGDIGDAINIAAAGLGVLGLGTKTGGRVIKRAIAALKPPASVRDALAKAGNSVSKASPEEFRAAFRNAMIDAGIDSDVADAVASRLNVIATGIGGDDVKSLVPQVVDRLDRSSRTLTHIDDRTPRGQFLKQMFGTTDIPQFKGLDDAAAWVESQVRPLRAMVDPNASYEDIVKAIEDKTAQEVDLWMKYFGDGYESFYTTSIQKANKDLKEFFSKRYGREVSDAEVELFHIMSAAASPQNMPEEEARIGMYMFDRFMNSGNISPKGLNVKYVQKGPNIGDLIVGPNGETIPAQYYKELNHTMLANLDKLVKQMGVEDAVKWLKTKHSAEEIKKVFGKVPDKHEYSVDRNAILGMFALGADIKKVGSYGLNKLGLLETITKDMWVARTMGRYMKQLLKNGKIVEVPWEYKGIGATYRHALDDAWSRVAKRYGLEPAQIQEIMWDFEQKLYGALGVSQPPSYIPMGIARAQDGTSIYTSTNPIAIEVVPGRNVPQLYGKMSSEDAKRATDEWVRVFTDPSIDNYSDVLSRMALERVHAHPGLGSYEGVLSPNITLHSYNMNKAHSVGTGSIVGHLGLQDAVAILRGAGEGSSRLAILSGNLDPKTFNAVFNDLKNVGLDVTFDPRHNVIIVGNFGGMPSRRFNSNLTEIAEKHGLSLDLKKSVGAYLEHSTGTPSTPESLIDDVSTLMAQKGGYGSYETGVKTYMAHITPQERRDVLNAARDYAQGISAVLSRSFPSESRLIDATVADRLEQVRGWAGLTHMSGGRILGDYDPSSMVARFVRGQANPETFVEEFAHHAHRVLWNDPEFGPILRQLYGEYDLATNREGLELAAKHFRQFVASGDAPSEEARNLFQRVAGWLKASMGSASASLDDVPDDVVRMMRTLDQRGVNDPSVVEDIARFIKRNESVISRSAEPISDRGESHQGPLQAPDAPATYQQSDEVRPAQSVPEPGVVGETTQSAPQPSMGDLGEAPQSVFTPAERHAIYSRLSTQWIIDNYEGAAMLAESGDPRAVEMFRMMNNAIRESAGRGDSVAARFVAQLDGTPEPHVTTGDNVVDHMQQTIEELQANRSPRQAQPVGATNESTEAAAPSPVPPSEPVASDAANELAPADAPSVWPRSSARQVDINRDLNELGMAGFTTDDIRHWRDLAQRADPNQVPASADAPWSDQETVNAVYRLRALKNKVLELRQRAASGEDVMSELVQYEDEFRALSRDLYDAGTEQGRALASRKYSLDEDMTAFGLTERYKARAEALGVAVDPGELQRLREIADAYEAAQKRILELEVTVAQSADDVQRAAAKTKPKTKGAKASEAQKTQGGKTQAARKTPTKARKSSPAEVKLALNDELEQLKRQLVQSMSVMGSGSQVIDAAVIIGKIAANRARYGYATVEEWLQSVHAALSDVGLSASDDEVINAYRQETTRTSPSKEIAELRARQALLRRRIMSRYPENVAAAEAKRLAAEESRSKRALEAARAKEVAARKRAQKRAMEAAERERRAAEARQVRESVRQAQEQYDAIHRERKAFTEARAKEAAEAKRAADEVRRLRQRIAELESSIKSGTGVGPTVKPNKAVDQEIAKLRARAYELQRKARAIYDDLNTPKNAALEAASEASGIFRFFNLGSDVGALLRQGLYGALSHPTAWARSAKTGARSLVNEDEFLVAMKAIDDREIDGVPMKAIRKRAGLSMTDALTDHEEGFVSRALSKIPVIGRPLERGQTAFLNALRADMFDTFYRLNPGVSESELKSYAKFINSSTGRSNLKTTSKLAAIVLTSPRYTASRIEMAVSPLTYARAAMAGDKGARRALADIGSAAATILTTLHIAKLAGADVSLDPTDTDFGTIRVGDDVYDVTAGVGKQIRTVARLLALSGFPNVGAGKNSPDINSVDVVGKHLGNMINPGIRTPYEMISGSTMGGFPQDDDRSGWVQAMPLIVQGVIDRMSSGAPVGQTAVGAGLDAVGIGSNRYRRSTQTWRQKMETAAARSRRQRA